MQQGFLGTLEAPQRVQGSASGGLGAKPPENFFWIVPEMIINLELLKV